MGYQKRVNRGEGKAATGQGPAFGSFWVEARATILLALPLIAGQVGQMLMGVADTVMIGRVGVVPLAASTFANTLLMVPFLFGVGLLTSVSIRVAQGRGAKQHDDVKHALRHGTWLAAGYGLLVVVLILATIPFLDRFGQPGQVVEEVPRYLLLAAISLVPAMISMGWKNYGDALNRPWVPFGILLSGVALNVLLNWIFIYGNLGSPALGLEGAGWATLLARTAVVGALYLWLMRSPAVVEWAPKRWWGRWKQGEFSTLLKLGVPIGLQLLAEVGSFAAASLMMGSLGVIALAAHQVALTCASVSFMVPLGVAMAITVRMGEASAGTSGWERRVRLRRILLGGWAYGLLFTGVSMTVFILFGRWLAGQIVMEPEVIELATGLLVIAGVFQMVDGSQVISSSALRGMGDVVVPAWLGIFAYWGVAVPLSAYLAFGAGLGAHGIWWGLAFGLGTAALLLGARVWRTTGRTMES
ncbi:MATE family efflux transporter [Verrucomicrobiaceae bacterium N1E253]|uniref:Multidrug-efflux transporter n=1 Tax=Oceaniferula marina TaxID=2748318 RepID=A0A851GRP1_9BACT|nr:MATE family efflux transporter [Oceaniferula marina]NWK56884.1 MATE family efflux transporter [Oceaniferula marina]